MCVFRSKAEQTAFVMQLKPNNYNDATKNLKKQGVLNFSFSGNSDQLSKSHIAGLSLWFLVDAVQHHRRWDVSNYLTRIRKQEESVEQVMRPEWRKDPCPVPTPVTAGIQLLQEMGRCVLVFYQR